MEFVNLRLPECSNLTVAVEEAPDGAFRPRGITISADAVVYLGALCDPVGNPRELVEIWIQEVEGIQRRFDATTAGLSNQTLDERWKKMVKGYGVADGPAVVRGPWESEHPSPSFLSEDGLEVIYPEGAWELCEDDELLRKMGLSTFSGTLHRYLVSLADPSGLRFVPLTIDAKRNSRTIPFEEAFPNLRHVNREGGLMMVRTAPAFAFDDFVDLLGGKEFEGGYRKLLRVPLMGNYEVFRDPAALAPPGAGFIHGRGRGGKRIMETVFLKLCALRAAFQAVRTAEAAQMVPFLNLSADSFGVSLGASPVGLPFLWSQQVRLRSASNVVPAALGVGDEEIHILCGEQPGASPYVAPGLTAPVEGSAKVRFGQPTPADDRGLSIVEGSLRTELSFDPSWHDLLELDVQTGQHDRLRLYAKFLPRRPDTSEHRFQTLDIELPEKFVEGSELVAPASFRVIPRLGSSRDLYSLGVLAIRTLMTRDGRPLADVHRDLMGGLLADYNRLFEEKEWDTGSRTLADYMLAGRGDEWRVALGPVLSGHGLSHEEAAEAIPERLWWQIVEFAARLLPGEIPSSFCSGFNDFEVRAPALVFDDPLSTIDGLIEQCRAVLFDDLAADREILTIIEALADQYGDGE